MRPMKRRLMVVRLALAIGLAGALGAARAQPLCVDELPMAHPTGVVESAGSAGDLAGLAELGALVDDWLLDWDTVLYLLFGDAVETKCRGDRDLGSSSAPGEEEPAYRCDPHPDTPK